MARTEWRVGWRRATVENMQYRVFGLEPTARKFIDKLQENTGNPIVELTIEARDVGIWELRWPPKPEAPIDSPCINGQGCCLHGSDPTLIVAVSSDANE